jgi:hypothetical protein
MVYLVDNWPKKKNSKTNLHFPKKKKTKDLALRFFILWSRGRVARQSSAKASTAVRIRSRPQVNSNFLVGIFLFYIDWSALLRERKTK